jgi:hypothetical protein
MQEFESISASSYDPSALATKLTAKAAEGWSVVAIVPTGGDVTAFLTRDKEGSAESTKPADTPDTKDDKDEAETPALVLPAKTEPATAEEATEPTVDDKTEEKEPVSEPSGWAIAPESTTTTPEPTGVQPTLAATGAAAAQPAAEAAGATTPATAAAATAAAATPAAAAAAHTPDPAPAPAVPAGWYADPAGRFELRYWDGSTWTEHVSRAGQQFTDPPVA